MDGDWQELSSMWSYDTFFSSLIHSSPNLNFMDANIPFLRSNHQEGGMNVAQLVQKMDDGPGSGGHTDAILAFSDEQKEKQQSPMRKRYHRHSASQTQVMELIFKHCPQPDCKQRRRLGQVLGLTPLQIKYWFQNHRTQMKMRQDRADNMILRAENQNLKAENLRLQSAICDLICPNCGGPAILGEMSYDKLHLGKENARLKQELERRLSCIPRISYMGIFPASNMPEQLPIGINPTPASTQAPFEGKADWGREGEAAEDWREMMVGGDQSWWSSNMVGDSPTELADGDTGKEEWWRRQVEEGAGEARVENC